MYKLLSLDISGNGLIDSDCGKHENITFKKHIDKHQHVSYFRVPTSKFLK